VVLIAGQVPHDVNDKMVGEGNFEAQVEQVFKNLGLALKAAGGDWKNLVKISGTKFRNALIRTVLAGSTSLRATNWWNRSTWSATPRASPRKRSRCIPRRNRPKVRRAIILDSSQLGLQIHESIGHPSNLTACSAWKQISRHEFPDHRKIAQVALRLGHRQRRG